MCDPYETREQRVAREVEAFCKSCEPALESLGLAIAEVIEQHRRCIAEKVAEAVREKCATEAGCCLEGEWAEEAVRSLNLDEIIAKVMEETTV